MLALRPNISIAVFFIRIDPDETIPGVDGRLSAILTQRLMAPPAVHVSGRVMQTSVWIPRSTH